MSVRGNSNNAVQLHFDVQYLRERLKNRAPRTGLLQESEGCQ
jgi:hypothetical protein